MQQPPREQAFRAGRRQVAILFADIQGYTAVMGTDEPLAQRYLALFREHLHQAVPAHNGEVINFYGDGCVATFESAVDATNCSIRLQTAFQNSDPVLPVRIGLHSGEVFFDESSVYGDNVNIASRVESMGVPGSVLVSARIYRDIANKGIFTAEDLGPFEFKNVDEPMNLFAITAAELVVPAREELNGKGRALPRERANRIPAAGKRWPLAMAAGILLLLAGYWFFLRGSFTAEEGYYATDEIRSARIAVIPFENKTGDVDLDALGTMAADWIIQGLMYLDDLELVSFENIQENIEFAIPQDSNQRFALRTGAEKAVRGRYYLDGDDIIVQSQVIDLETGEVELSLPRVIGKREAKSELVSELQETYTTIFAARNHKYSPGVAQNPPHYKAYQLYQQGADIYGEDFAQSRVLNNKALAIDSNFFWPYVFNVGSYFMEGKKSKADSVYALIPRKLDVDLLPKIEKSWYLHWGAILDRDLKRAYKTIRDVLELDPKQFLANLETAIMANDLNMPEEVVRVCELIDPEYIEVNGASQAWWHRTYAHNLYRLGEYGRALKILEYIPERFRDHANYYNRRAEIYLAQKDQQALTDLLTEMEREGQRARNIAGTYLFIAEQCGVRGEDDQRKEWARAGARWMVENVSPRRINPYLLGALHYLAEEYEVALPLLERSVEEISQRKQHVSGSGSPWTRFSRLAACQFQLGDEAAFAATMNRMESEYERTEAPGYLIAQAHGYALREEPARAVGLVKAAFADAHPYGPRSYGNDYGLATLRGFPAFEEFVKRKG